MLTVTEDIRNNILNDFKDYFESKFRYKVLQVPDIEEDMLNDFSKNGWALVNIVNYKEGFKVIFKSPIK